jgi:hypothetical protein
MRLGEFLHEVILDCDASSHRFYEEPPVGFAHDDIVIG